VACDVLVAGAGMGGIGAALAAARHGLTVCLTEETDWIGGQATAGGVSALDENRFIERAGAQFTSAVAWQFDKHAAVRFRFRWVLDVTEMGDLLPLAKLPFVSGSEPKSETGEPHAAAEPNPGCVQSFTYPFAVERRDGENHAITKPEDYDAIRKRQDF